MKRNENLVREGLVKITMMFTDNICKAITGASNFKLDLHCMST